MSQSDGNNSISSENDFLGRPEIKNNTIYTAWDTRIRGGVCIIHDDDERFYSETIELIQNARENGLNALHVYLESPQESYDELMPIGHRAEKCDFVVEEAAKNGLYVIITMGGMDERFIEKESLYMYEFWEFYAPRYMDYEHVIYEICNESPAPPENLMKAYEIIRRHAPDTMVIFYSFAHSMGLEADILPKLRELDHLGVTWQNEAVGFHAYESTNDAMGSDWINYAIDAMIGAGYPIINTEVPGVFHHAGYVNAELIQILEDRGISWLSFCAQPFDPRQYHRWRGQLEAHGVAWEPDYGNWPLTDAIYPFGVANAAENIYRTTAKTVNDQEQSVLAFTDSGYVQYNKLNFGTREPLAFRISIKSESGGIFSIRAAGPDGLILGSCEAPADKDYITVSGDIFNAVSGISDIAFAFESHPGGETFFRAWQFVRPARASDTDPQELIYAANYPYRSGDIVRRPSTDSGSAARLHVEGITNNSFLLFDFVRFTENIVTVPFYMRDTQVSGSGNYETVPFSIRAMPMAGGVVEIWAGEAPFSPDFLGELELNGQPGVWADFSCELDIGLTFWENDTFRQDFMLLFKGEDGKELYAISEFFIGNEKPVPAGTLDLKVTTGNPKMVGTDSVAIEGNEFVGFNESEIIEAGVVYSLVYDHPLFLDDPGIMNYVKAGISKSPFAVILTGIEPAPDPDSPFYTYRAYVKTTEGMHFGNAKRFKTTN
jgi:hypothetical protein